MTTVNVILHHRKLNNQNHPVYIQVISKHNVIEQFSIKGGKFQAKESQWNTKTQCFKTNLKDLPEASRLNLLLFQQKKQIFEIIHEFEKNNISWTKDLVEQQRKIHPATAEFYAKELYQSHKIDPCNHISSRIKHLNNAPIFKVKTILNKGRKLKNGGYPICLAISYRKKKKNIKTKR